MILYTISVSSSLLCFLQLKTNRMWMKTIKNGKSPSLLLWWTVSLSVVTGSRKRKRRSWRGSCSCHSLRSNVTSTATEAGFQWATNPLKLFCFYFLNPEMLSYYKCFIYLFLTWRLLKESIKDQKKQCECEWNRWQG